jgi:hypothetical protein
VLITSATTTSLSNTLPSSVPKLDIRNVVEAKGFWGHFDGTTKRPIMGTAQSLASDGKTVQAYPLSNLQLKQPKGRKTRDQPSPYSIRKFPTLP